MDLLELLPEQYAENATMKELQDILSEKINGIASGFNETIDQCFVSTATDLLSRYEKIYGLSVDVTKTNESRRERIVARARGTGTVTKQMLEAVASSYSFAEVEVIEDTATYSFIVKFVGTKGLPPNMAALTVTINEIKPAHLSFTFEYIYNTHAQLSMFTHAQLAAYTHAQLREGDLI